MTLFVRFMKLSLTLMMMAYIVTVSCFQHTHIVDSEVVSHSHPYQNSSHEHNSSEFFFFYLLSNVVTDGHFETIDFAPKFEKICEITSAQTDFCAQFSPIYYSLRAPPFLS